MRFLYSIYHFLLAWSGSLYYGRPSRKLFIIGVTGTKGKSTAIELMNAILEKGDKKTAVFSSTRRKVGNENNENQSDNTMPGRWQIQKFLKRALIAECDYVLLEVTSQGTLQHRHRFIDWDIAIFLNLTPEHIEAHGSFEKYRDAKIKFFRYLKHSGKKQVFFLINKDDPSAIYFEKAAKETEGEIKLFSKDDIYKLVESLKEMSRADWLKADFNVENAASAAALAEIIGINRPVVERALGEFKGLGGRMDFVQKKPFSVVVDYAHTPHSLKLVYKNLREEYAKPNNSKLICVLGSAGGGRDKWKRPEMGKIAANYCDKLVLTSEDPYDESPQVIIDEIKKGVSKSQSPPEKVYEILDRREALQYAISLANPGDVVITTGKGSEKWFYGPRGQKIPWDEKGVVEEILKEHG